MATATTGNVTSNVVVAATRATIPPSSKVVRQVTTPATITADDAAQGQFLFLRVDLDPTDLANTDLALVQTIEVSKDGKNWQQTHSAVWYGDPTTVDLGMPCIGDYSSNFIGLFVRGSVSVPTLPSANAKLPADQRTKATAVHSGLSLEIADALRG